MEICFQIRIRLRRQSQQKKIVRQHTHTDTRKKQPARNGKHWEHKRYWPNQNRIRMRKYVMNVVSSMKRSIDAWAVSTDHTISIFLSLAIVFARLQINEYSRSDKKDWKCCFKLNLLGKSVFVKIIFRKSVDLNQKSKRRNEQIVWWLQIIVCFIFEKKNEIPLTENKWVSIPATYWCAKWINRRGRRKTENRSMNGSDETYV